MFFSQICMFSYINDGSIVASTALVLNSYLRSATRIHVKFFSPFSSAHCLLREKRVVWIRSAYSSESVDILV